MSIEDILHKHIHQEQACRALAEKDALLQHSNDHVVAIESTLHVIGQVQSLPSISHEPHVYMHSYIPYIWHKRAAVEACTTLSLSHTLTDLSEHAQLSLCHTHSQIHLTLNRCIRTIQMKKKNVEKIMSNKFMLSTTYPHV